MYGSNSQVSILYVKFPIKVLKVIFLRTLITYDISKPLVHIIYEKQIASPARGRWQSFIINDNNLILKYSREYDFVLCGYFSHKLDTWN